MFTYPTSCRSNYDRLDFRASTILQTILLAKNFSYVTSREPHLLLSSYVIHCAHNIEISREFTSLFHSFSPAFAFLFLRFPSNFHISMLMRSHRIPHIRAGAYPLLCITRTYFADSLNWIEKRGYGKDTSAMVHHADRYSCRRASGKLLYTGNTSFISRSISVVITR